MNIEEKFKKIKSKYRKKTKIQCSAFSNEAIVLGADFWKHLMYQKNRRLRTDEEISNRLDALSNLIEIVENAQYYQDYYVGKDKNNIVHFWLILANIEDTRYGVIIRRKGVQGNKHLYSIIPNWKGYIPRTETKNHKVHVL